MQKINCTKKKIMIATLLLAISTWVILFSATTYAHKNQMATESQNYNTKNYTLETNMEVNGTDSSMELEYIELSE